MNDYIIHWKTTVNSFSSRGGYCVIRASNKIRARRDLRLQLKLYSGEKLRIIGGAQELSPCNL